MKTALWQRVVLLFTTASSLAFGVVSPPVLSPGEGDSFTQFSLTISATPGAEIHYTLSGAEPTKYDPLITSGSAILINRNWTVKAKAWLGAEASATSIGNYLLTSDIAAGNAHSLALKSTGELSSWGLQDARLGGGVVFGTPTTRCRYGNTSFVYDAAMVGAGGSHTVFLKNDGTVWSFGSNSKGELGNNTTTASSIAVQVRGYISPTTSKLGSCVAVAAGNGFSMALLNFPMVNIMGDVFAWGDGTLGRLGNGQTSGTQIYPRAVYMGTSGYTKLTGINRISAGSAFALAKEPCAKETAGANGYVWVWGDNASGQLGQGNTTMLTRAAKMKLSSGVFLTDALDVSCKEAHSAIVRWKDGDPSMLGRVYCCGQQSYGRLGNNLTTTASVTYPVVVVKSGGIPLDGIISVAAGSAHTLALDVNGNVWAWGCNDKGALGDNTVTSRGTAAKVKNSTGTGDLSNVVRIAAGGAGLLGHSMAVAADGTVYTWGYNGNGQLGNGTTSTGATMLPIAAPSSLKLLPQPPDTTLTHAITKASAPGAVTLTANPTDPNNDITQVDFYSQGVRVGAAGYPWKINLTNLSAGSYHTYAVVTDAANSLGYSLPCDFTILPASNPTVSLACAVTAGMFPGAVTLSATPSDPDGDLNRVEYFLDGIKVGQSVASPWVMNLSNLKVGNHTVYAVAKDSYGLTGTSQTLPFTIIYDPTLDSDGDGLFDFMEDAIGTSPVNPDTDGDGMPDGWEVKYNLNPKNPTDATADADLDGITNLNEYLSGKNPIVAEDADQDGVPDYVEIKLIYWKPSGDWGYFDPNKTDTDDNGTPDGQEDCDKDGMTTLQEIAAGTDPNKSDTDADGVNDGMEISLGSDPLTSDPWSTRDTDHDGLTDLMEIMIGTDYQNADTNGNGMNDGDELNNGGNPANPGPPPPVLPPTSGTPETPADPAPVNPPSLPPGNYDILTQVKNISFQKYGYAPFQLLDPPRRYLRMSSYQSFSGGSPESGPLGITGSTTSTIHALTGATATTGDDFVNTGGQPTSPLIRSGSDTLDSYDDPPNEEYDAPGTREYKTTLSNENTTAMMVANGLSLLPEFTGSFQAGTPFAYRNVHQNQLAIDYQKTKFKFRWQQGTTAEQRYALTFLVIFQPEDDPGTTEDESTKNAEVVKSIPWDGQTEESPEYTIDPETYKPGADGTYSLLPVELKACKRGSVQNPGAAISGAEVVNIENADLDQFDHEANARTLTPADVANGDLQDSHKNRSGQKLTAGALQFDDDFVKFYCDGSLIPKGAKLTIKLELVPPAGARAIATNQIFCYTKDGDHVDLSQLKLTNAEIPISGAMHDLFDKDRGIFVEIGDLGSASTNQSQTERDSLKECTVRLNIGDNTGTDGIKLKRGGFWVYDRTLDSGLSFRDGLAEFKSSGAIDKVDDGVLLFGPYATKSGQRGCHDDTIANKGPTPAGWWMLTERTGSSDGGTFEWRPAEGRWMRKGNCQSDRAKFPSPLSDSAAKNKDQTPNLYQGAYSLWDVTGHFEAGQKVYYPESDGNTRPTSIMFKFDLNKAITTQTTRTDIQIHPDGHNDGTLGCIGLQNYQNAIRANYLLNHLRAIPISVRGTPSNSWNTPNN